MNPTPRPRGAKPASDALLNRSTVLALSIVAVIALAVVVAVVALASSGGGETLEAQEFAAFFVNGEPIQPQSPDDLRARIDEALAR